MDLRFDEGPVEAAHRSPEHGEVGVTLYGTAVLIEGGPAAAGRVLAFREVDGVRRRAGQERTCDGGRFALKLSEAIADEGGVIILRLEVPGHTASERPVAISTGTVSRDLQLVSGPREREPQLRAVDADMGKMLELREIGVGFDLSKGSSDDLIPAAAWQPAEELRS